MKHFAAHQTGACGGDGGVDKVRGLPTTTRKKRCDRRVVVTVTINIILSQYSKSSLFTILSHDISSTKCESLLY